MVNPYESLPQVIEGLQNRSKEFQNWFNNLRGHDQQNVQAFLKGSYKWAVELWAADQSKYFSMNAVGSTTRGKPDYQDIDFLLLTDSPLAGIVDGHFWNGERLGELVRGTHRIEKARVEREGTKEIYADMLEDFPDRDLLTVVPLKGMDSPWKKIHLILQPNVRSLEEWNTKERFGRVEVFYIGEGSKPNL